MLVSPAHNTFVNPTATPLLLTGLAVLGAIYLYRREPRHALFLLGWLGLYFVVHAYVVSDVLVMQARYHLHLAPPIVLLAAPALGRAWDAGRSIGALATCLLALAPWLHRGFVRDTGYNDMREFAFVESARDLVPSGCTVLEYLGPGEASRDARFSRMAATLERGRRGGRFQALGVGGSPEPLSPDALEMVANPPECLFVYEGLLCYGLKSFDDRLAPACVALHERLELTPVATEAFMSRPYDENLSRGLPRGEPATITLSLYRALGRKASAAGR